VLLLYVLLEERRREKKDEKNKGRGVLVAVVYHAYMSRHLIPMIPV